MRAVFALAGVAATLAFASSAHAADVLVSGMGLFDSSAPTTAETAPNEQYSFSFYTPSDAGSYQDSDIIDPTYTLNGKSISTVIDQASFQTGGLSLGFTDNSFVGYAGADIGSKGAISSPSFGNYEVKYAPAGAQFGDQIGSGVVTTSYATPPTAAVPEPATWAFMIAGLGGTAFMARRKVRAALTA